MLGLPLNVDLVAQGTSPVLLLTSTQPPRDPSLVPCVAWSFSLDWFEVLVAQVTPDSSVPHGTLGSIPPCCH